MQKNPSTVRVATAACAALAGLFGAGALGALLLAAAVLGNVVLAGRPAAAAGPPPAGGVRAAPTVAPTSTWWWPLDGQPAVVRGFEPPPQPWLPGHRGVDLAAVPGTTVRAAGAGRVGFAGQVAGLGVLSVEHAGGLRTTYQPVAALRAEGDEVAAGDPIGVLVPGHAGCPVQSCLHWGLRAGEVYLDPLALLGSVRVRLLPLASRTEVVNPAGAAAPAGRLPAGRTPRARCRPGRTAVAARRRAGR